MLSKRGGKVNGARLCLQIPRASSSAGWYCTYLKAPFVCMGVAQRLPRPRMKRQKRRLAVFYTRG